jgi:hypothetical protein
MGVKQALRQVQGMPTIDSGEALRTYILGQYQSLSRVEPECAKFTCPAIDPPLEEDESRDFMRGIDAGLFSVDDHGYYASPMRAIKGILFGHTSIPGKRNLSRESISQIAGAAALGSGLRVAGWPGADRIRRLGT